MGRRAPTILLGSVFTLFCIALLVTDHLAICAEAISDSDNHAKARLLERFSPHSEFNTARSASSADSCKQPMILVEEPAFGCVSTLHCLQTSQLPARPVSIISIAPTLFPDNAMSLASVYSRV